MKSIVKKTCVYCLIIVMAVGLMAGCGSDSQSDKEEQNSGEETFVEGDNSSEEVTEETDETQEDKEEFHVTSQEAIANAEKMFERYLVIEFAYKNQYCGLGQNGMYYVMNENNKHISDIKQIVCLDSKVGYSSLRETMMLFNDGMVYGAYRSGYVIHAEQVASLGKVIYIDKNYGMLLFENGDIVDQWDLYQYANNNAELVVVCNIPNAVKIICSGYTDKNKYSFFALLSNGKVVHFYNNNEEYVEGWDDIIDIDLLSGYDEEILVGLTSSGKVKNNVESLSETEQWTDIVEAKAVMGHGNGDDICLGIIGLKSDGTMICSDNLPILKEEIKKFHDIQFFSVEGSIDVVGISSHNEAYCYNRNIDCDTVWEDTDGKVIGKRLVDMKAYKRKYFTEDEVDILPFNREDIQYREFTIEEYSKLE